MPQSLSRVILHLIFSTNDRAPTLADEALRRDLQALHHRRLSFQDEYRAFLRRHGVDFDERYVWD